MRRRPEMAAAALFAASIAGEAKAQPDTTENKAKTQFTADARVGTAPLPGTAAYVGGEVGAKRHVHLGRLSGEVAGTVGAGVGLKRSGEVDGAVASVGASALAEIPRAPFNVKVGPTVDLRLAAQRGVKKVETGIGARAEVDLAPGVHAGLEYKAVIGLGQNTPDHDAHGPHIAHEGGVNVGIDF